MTCDLALLARDVHHVLAVGGEAEAPVVRGSRPRRSRSCVARGVVGGVRPGRGGRRGNAIDAGAVAVGRQGVRPGPRPALIFDPEGEGRVVGAGEDRGWRVPGCPRCSSRAGPSSSRWRPGSCPPTATPVFLALPRYHVVLELGDVGSVRRWAAPDGQPEHLGSACGLGRIGDVDDVHLARCKRGHVGDVRPSRPRPTRYPGRVLVADQHGGGGIRHVDDLEILGLVGHVDVVPAIAIPKSCQLEPDAEALACAER